MADIRIKDLATTATTTASDDFMAVDGSTNGTRKMNAAAPAFLTSVTTPSLTAPAATDLTLAGGSSGASLVLGATTSGVATLSTVLRLNPAIATMPTGGVYGQVLTSSTGGSGVFPFNGLGHLVLAPRDNSVFGVVVMTGTSLANVAGYFTGTGNLLIGTTDATGLTGAGGLKINSSTAGSAGAGALVVTGGLSAGGASYFGGAVTVASTISSTGKTTVTSGNIRLSNAYYLSGNLAAGTEITMIGRRSDDKIAIDPDGYGVVFGGGAATFAGTVIAPAATASLAPLRIPHGTAPTSPTDGDMWTTTAGLYIRINGATVGPLS